MEFNNITVVESEKLPKGRPRKYNFIEIEGEQLPSQDIKTKEKYHSQYYQDNKHIKVQCPVCNKLVQKYTIGKHQRTQYCQLVKKVLEKGNVHLNNESTF